MLSHARVVLGIVSIVAVLGASGESHAASQPAQEVSSQARAAVQQFMQGESVFIENKGQWADREIRYALNGMGANVGLTDRGPRFQLFRSKAEDSTSSLPGGSESSLQAAGGSSPPLQSALQDAPKPSEIHEFRAILEGAEKVTPKGEGKAEQTFNYLVGDVAQQRQNVPSYSTVWYRGVYSGINLELKGRRTGLKYNFHVAPNADWRQIQIRYEGIDQLSINPDGSLKINLTNDWPAISDGVPVLYQEIDGKRVSVEGRYRLIDKHTYGFEVTGDYDKTKALVIDPEMEWGTYLGGSRSEQGSGIAIDGSGNVYFTGATDSPGWVSGGWDTSLGDVDAYLVKLNSSGAHQWSSYLGGSSFEMGNKVAVDGSGNVYVAGVTDTPGWVSGGWDTSYSGNNDGFIVKLSSEGAHLWSSYDGGADWDLVNGIGVDGSGNVFVTGYTDSPDWVSGGWDTSHNGLTDSYVVKLSPEGAHQWSSYLGGSESESGNGIAVDGTGNVYVTGYTDSFGWVSGGWNGFPNGYSDGFVVKLSPEGAHLWSSYLGGNSNDYAFGIAVDSTGDVYAAGRTNSSGWVSGGWDITHDGNDDGYVVKLSSEGEHLWSTYLGGTAQDSARHITVDGNGNAYVTGSTNSPGWVSGPLGTTLNGGLDCLVAKFNSAGVHQWSRYVGGSGDDTGTGIAVGVGGNVYLAGSTYSSGWLSDGWDVTFSGGNDCFAVSLSAIWSLTYVADPNGSISGLRSQLVLNGEDGLVVTAEPNTGYHFVQWSDGLLSAARTDTDVTRDVNVTAEFEGNTYTVTFDAQGGTTPSPPTQQATFDSAYGALATTSRTGYTFDGWFTAPGGGGTEVTEETVLTTVGEHTLYAQWTANNYTVTFDAQGGTTPSPPSQQATFDSAYGALATTSRSGYTFDGWFTAPIGGTQVIAETLVTMAGDHTLYAQWTARTYTVTFNARGGTAPTPASKQATFNAAYGELPTTSRTGYTFDGWFTAPSGGTQVTAETIVATARHHVLYAQWTIIHFTLTYIAGANGTISGVSNQVVNYGAAGSAVTATPDPGYHFVQWSDGVQSATRKDANVIANLSVTASFARDTGSLAVTIRPQAARLAGAKWRRTGTSTWFNSGQKETGIPTGEYSIEFKTLAQWSTPAIAQVTIVKNTVQKVDVTYSQTSVGNWEGYR